MKTLPFAPILAPRHAPSTGTPPPTTNAQPELFPIEQIQGFSSLDRRERLYAQAILDGCNQTEAARRAGIGGSDSYIRKMGATLARKPTVRAVINQAWSMAGANIDATLRRTAAIAQRAYAEWENGETAEKRAAARAEWHEAETLLANVHAKFSVRVDGLVGHLHHHSNGALGSGDFIVVPPESLAGFAAMRQETVAIERLRNATPVPGAELEKNLENSSANGSAHVA